MRKIILASGSKARQRLLRQIGLKFEVAKSNVKEKRTFKKSCSDLVIQNALRKAREAAGRLSAGVVIAADTVVLVGKKIVAKPKNIKDAHRTLKLLSRKPQWVYTGLAVIDIEGRKEFATYEKTKIYMYKLTDSQIKRYFKKVSPLDKAGSFDIQGPGGAFIDRIEGCFYNVVGLPLAKLARILEKIGFDIF
ncbi:MAG: septum formation protein Maf [Candidatus Omnitrophica bacterium]|nr:septum formation protein Maf [Candidatus Omnitrophota bacterium]